jgi:hypothetical protein
MRRQSELSAKHKLNLKIKGICRFSDSKSYDKFKVVKRRVGYDDQQSQKFTHNFSCRLTNSQSLYSPQF